MNWQKILSFLLIILLLAGFGYLYYRKASQLTRLRHREAEYREKVDALESRAVIVLKEIESLQTDAGLEKIGREKLGLVGENEVIFILEPTPPPGGR